MGETLTLRDALQLAIDWHNPDTRGFIATWGHGMSGREMVAILREAVVKHDGTMRTCDAGDGWPGEYCGWDMQWLCSNHAPTDRHHEHRLAFPVFERAAQPEARGG